MVRSINKRIQKKKTMKRLKSHGFRVCKSTDSPTKLGKLFFAYSELREYINNPFKKDFFN